MFTDRAYLSQAPETWPREPCPSESLHYCLVGLSQSDKCHIWVEWHFCFIICRLRIIGELWTNSSFTGPFLFSDTKIYSTVQSRRVPIWDTFVARAQMSPDTWEGSLRIRRRSLLRSNHCRFRYAKRTEIRPGRESKIRWSERLHNGYLGWDY